MKATVKRAYFDLLGLHKVGEVVEVKGPSINVEIIEEVKTVKVETKTEEKVEETPKKTKKPTTKSAKTKPKKTTKKD